MVTIGDNLKRIRTKILKISQVEMNRTCCFTYDAIYTYENNVRPISISRIQRIREYYDIPLEEFFKDIVIKPNRKKG